MQTISIIVLSVSGGTLCKQEVAAGHTCGELRHAVSETLGFPSNVMKLLRGVEELLDDDKLLEASTLTAVFALDPTPQALGEAAVAGQLQYAKAILEAVPSGEARKALLVTRPPETVDLYITPLHGAVWEEKQDVAGLLLRSAVEEGALREVLLKSDDRMLLQAAALMGHEAVVRQILSAAASEHGLLREVLLAREAYEFDHTEKTALECATWAGHVAVTQALLEAAMEEGALRELLLKYDRMLLRTVAHMGYKAVVRQILSAAASEHGLLQELLLAREAYEFDHPERTALECATLAGHVAITQALLETAGEEEGSPGALPET